MRRARADIGCAVERRGPALLDVVKSYGERNRFGQFCDTLLGPKGGLREGHWHESSDATGDCRSHSIRAIAGRRMEAVSTCHACAVVLPADAAAERCRVYSGLRQGHNYAAKQKQYYRNGNATPHEYADFST